jgi:mannonate dehydratase
LNTDRTINAVTREILPGTGEIRKGYLYGSGLPGLGLDINEELAAMYPIGEIRNGGRTGRIGNR